MRLLVVTTWFPTASHPATGVFVARDVAALAQDHDVLVLGNTGWTSFAEVMSHAEFDAALGATRIAVDAASLLILFDVAPDRLTADAFVLL